MGGVGRRGGRGWGKMKGGRREDEGRPREDEGGTEGG
jgi:hypothetical protein